MRAAELQDWRAGRRRWDQDQGQNDNTEHKCWDQEVLQGEDQNENIGSGRWDQEVLQGEDQNENTENGRWDQEVLQGEDQNENTENGRWDQEILRGEDQNQNMEEINDHELVQVDPSTDQEGGQSVLYERRRCSRLIHVSGRSGLRVGEANFSRPSYRTDCEEQRGSTLLQTYLNHNDVCPDQTSLLDIQEDEDEEVTIPFVRMVEVSGGEDEEVTIPFIRMVEFSEGEDEEVI